MLFERLITSESEVLDMIKTSLSNHDPILLTYINQHSFNVYFSNEVYRNVIDQKFIIYAADTGINFANRFLLGIKYKPFNGSDLNERIIQILLATKVKFFIMGGNFKVDDLKRHFDSNHSFVGYHSGYFSDSELGKISEEIASLKPDVVLIGMGVPKQEIITARISEIVNTSLFICVGNFFEFYFGTVQRIPLRFRDKGIEWIFRLFHEPKRLWKRYIIGIPLFILRVLKYKLFKQ